MEYCHKFGTDFHNITSLDVWFNQTNNTTIPVEKPRKFQDIMVWQVYPAICAFGLLGNLLALVVLLSRIREGVEILEKSCLVGMIGKWFL